MGKLKPCNCGESCSICYRNRANAASGIYGFLLCPGHRLRHDCPVHKKEFEAMLKKARGGK